LNFYIRYLETHTHTHTLTRIVIIDKIYISIVKIFYADIYVDSIRRKHKIRNIISERWRCNKRSPRFLGVKHFGT